MNFLTEELKKSGGIPQQKKLMKYEKWHQYFTQKVQSSGLPNGLPSSVLPNFEPCIMKPELNQKPCVENENKLLQFF